MALEALVAKYGPQLAPEPAAALVPETAALISDAGESFGGGPGGKGGLNGGGGR